MGKWLVFRFPLYRVAKGIKVWDPLEPCLGAITMLVHEAQLRGGERDVWQQPCDNTSPGCSGREAEMASASVGA